MMGKLYTLLCIVGGLFLPFFSIAQPVANFSSNITGGCPPIVVNFTDQSTGSPTSWYWNLGNGTTSTLQNPSTTYLTAGTYTVSLTVTNSSGTNTKQVTSYITVAPAPAVSFTADSSVHCGPKTVAFTNTSTPGGSGTASYLWDFGDGNTSTQQNPIHTYSVASNYTVSLVITNSNGCTNTLTKNNYIKLNPKPLIGFSASNTASCSVPHTSTFTNTSTGGSSYYWDFGDGATSTQQSPSHTYTTAGIYTVKLVVAAASGCKDSLVKTAFINAGMQQAAFTSSNTGCAGAGMTFTNTTSPAASSYTWQFGNGATSSAQSPSYTYASAGTYNVKLIAHYASCSDTAVKSITIGAKPSVQFTGNATTSCATPFTVQFSNTTTGAISYDWSFGTLGNSTQQNPSFTFNNTGNHTIKLVATSSLGCKDSLTRSSYIKISKPAAGIRVSPSSGCVPATVTATDISSAASITNYSWDFGDGSPISSCGTCSTKTHTYTTAGSYLVKLTFTTSTGCTVTTERLVKYGNKPTASFSASDTVICPATTVNFSNTSTGANSYLWLFDNNATSTLTNPTRTYSVADTYSVSLIASHNGCADTAKKTNYIKVMLPEAKFTTSFNCASRKAITFTDASRGANTYFWEFGDGTTATTSGNVSHTYASYGTYTTKLTVTNAATGCTHTYTKSLDVYAIAPQFSVDDTTLCRGTAATFTSPANSNHGSYTWRFGNGASQTGTSNTTSYTYTANGTYSPTLVVTDKNGCKDSITKSSYIKVMGPVASFTGSPVSGCVPLSVNFNDASTANGGAITSRAWDFGNGNTTAAATTFSRQYTAAGTFTVKLNLTDANGCKDSITRANYISVTKPTAAFTTPDTSVCGNQNVRFTNASAGSSLTYKWSFGDGNTATSASPTYTYTNGGQYAVKLVVTDANGCKDSITKNALVKVSVPKPVFTMSDSFATCPPLVVNFDNKSTGAASYSWSFGNNSTSVLDTPATVYTYPGTYKVKLIALSANGCKDSATKTVTILGPTGTFSYNVTGCLPLTVNFSATAKNTVAYIWDMNNGVTKMTSTSSTSYTYLQSGKYLPKLILSDGGSCLVPIQGRDTIMVDSVSGDFSFTSTDALCGSGTVHFKDTVYSSINPVTSRSWNFGDGGTSTLINPSHTYTAPGTYTVRLILGNSKGCNDTILKTVTVHPRPTVSAGSNIAVCAGTSAITLQASGTGRYSWVPSTGLSCDTCANPSLTPINTNTYTVIGTDSNGCKDTASVTVTVRSKPNISAGADRAICEGFSASLQATGGVTYTWSPAGGLSCTTCPNPIASPAASTTYVVTGTDSNACTASDTVLVTVNAKPVVNAGTDKSLCLGSTVQLLATGANTYEWSPATGLSCTTCANPIATPTSTTTYTVIGTTVNGCRDTTEVTVVVNPLPVIIVASEVICAGSSVTMNATGATTYDWSPSTGLSCNNCASPVASPLATTTYTITGTDSNGCVADTTATVTVKPLPVVNAEEDTTICEGSSVELHVTGAASYIWSPATGLSCTTCANPVASPAATTAYVVTGTTNGCSKTDTVVVNVLPTPEVTAGPDVTICEGESVVLTASGAATYKWSPAAGLPCASCSVLTVAPPATTKYILTGVDSNGCATTSEVTVIVRPLPKVDAGPDKEICEEGSVTLHAKGANRYIWSPADGLSCDTCDKPSASPNTSMTYMVMGIDEHGCRDSDDVRVTIIHKKETSAGAGDTLCKGEAAQLSAAGGTSYLWLPANGLSDNRIENPIAMPSATTTYRVQVKQGTCFVDTYNVTVVVHDYPAVNAGEDIHTAAGHETKINTISSGASRYEWTPAQSLSCSDCASPIAKPNVTTTYKVIAYNELGCKTEDEITIYTTCGQDQLFIANTFTPNGDGVNDYFFPQGRGISEAKRFRVYNRWGELLFDRQNMPLNNELQGWDGTHKGQQLKPDVFVYILNAVCESGEPIEMKGDISLIR